MGIDIEDTNTFTSLGQKCCRISSNGALAHAAFARKYGQISSNVLDAVLEAPFLPADFGLRLRLSPGLTCGIHWVPASLVNHPIHGRRMQGRR
jgi:hypothetical protein